MHLQGQRPTDDKLLVRRPSWLNVRPHADVDDHGLAADPGRQHRQSSPSANCAEQSSLSQLESSPDRLPSSRCDDETRSFRRPTPRPLKLNSDPQDEGVRCPCGQLATRPERIHPLVRLCLLHRRRLQHRTGPRWPRSSPRAMAAGPAVKHLGTWSASSSIPPAMSSPRQDRPHRSTRHRFCSNERTPEGDENYNCPTVVARSRSPDGTPTRTASRRQRRPRHQTPRQKP